MNTERVCVLPDNFKPESIDLYKPGTIEVKKEGDRKTAAIERASTAVSLTILPNVFCLYPWITRGTFPYDSTDSRERVSYLLAQKPRPGM